jgi:hypothetical protein
MWSATSTAGQKEIFNAEHKRYWSENLEDGVHALSSRGQRVRFQHRREYTEAFAGEQVKNNDERRAESRIQESEARRKSANRPPAVFLFF